MANKFTFLRSLHLLLSTSLCLHVILERNINLVHEISSENVMTKIFHTNYLELKLTQMKIKQITVLLRQYLNYLNTPKAVFAGFIYLEMRKLYRRYTRAKTCSIIILLYIYL